MENRIKNRAKELCKIYTANQFTVQERNKRIVDTLMKEFKITEEYATHCFLHNNERSS